MRCTIPYDDIDQLARRQAGHIARWQLLALGVPETVVDSLVARAGWRATGFKGTWRLPGHPDDELGGLWAAVLTAASTVQRDGDSGDGPVGWEQVHQRARQAYGATAFSSAWVRRLTPKPPAKHQLLLPHDARCRVPEIQVVRTRAPVGELDQRTDPPSVGVIRMLWDCAQLLARNGGTVGQLRRLITRADGLRLLRAEDLHQVVSEPAVYGLPRVVPPLFRRAAGSVAGGHSHSATEARGRKIVTEVAASLGLAVHPRPLALPDEDDPVGEADVAIPRILLDMEIDGPHHDDPDQQRYDRWRDGRVTDIGWTVLRYRAELIDKDPERFRRLVEADIRRVAAAAGVPLRVNA